MWHVGVWPAGNRECRIPSPGRPRLRPQDRRPPVQCPEDASLAREIASCGFVMLLSKWRSSSVSLRTAGAGKREQREPDGGERKGNLRTERGDGIEAEAPGRTEDAADKQAKTYAFTNATDADARCEFDDAERRDQEREVAKRNPPKRFCRRKDEAPVPLIHAREQGAVNEEVESEHRQPDDEREPKPTRKRQRRRAPRRAQQTPRSSLAVVMDVLGGA